MGYVRRPYFLCLVLLITVTTIVLAQSNSPSAPRVRLLTYVFEPTVTATSAVLHVTLKFQGDAKGTEEIELPSHWAGQSNHLHALSSETTIADTAESNIKVIRFTPNSPVSIAYDLIKDWD